MLTASESWPVTVASPSSLGEPFYVDRGSSPSGSASPLPSSVQTPSGFVSPSAASASSASGGSSVRAVPGASPEAWSPGDVSQVVENVQVIAAALTLLVLLVAVVTVRGFRRDRR